MNHTNGKIMHTVYPEGPSVSAYSSFLCLSFWYKPLIISILINVNKKQQKSLLSPNTPWSVENFLKLSLQEAVSRQSLVSFCTCNARGTAMAQRGFFPQASELVLSTSRWGWAVRPNASLQHNFILIFIAGLVIRFALILPLCQIRHCYTALWQNLGDTCFFQLAVPGNTNITFLTHPPWNLGALREGLESEALWAIPEKLSKLPRKSNCMM